MKFRIEVVNVPTHWPEFGRLRLVWQSRVRPQEFRESADHCWEIDVAIKDGKWTGPAVGKNPDGRRFVYLAWLTEDGRICRRIKLYEDQVAEPVIRILPTMPDGSPACSTARLDTAT